MRPLNTRRSFAALAVVATAGLVLAGCGGGGNDNKVSGKSPGEGKPECAQLTKYGDLTGKKVHIYTSIVAPEDKPHKDSYKLFTTCTGARVQYEGSKKFEAQLVVRVKSGNPPDIAYVPQPGLLKTLVQDTGKVVLQKNASAVMPIASLTKLMTGLVISEAKLPMDEKIRISSADVDRLKFSSSHLPVGTELTRRQALHLALMASENRAAHALARTYPGGEPAFVSAMNNKARLLGMEDTRYVEPTGLSSGNHSSARDLAVLAATAYKRPLLREFTTSKAYALAVPGRKLRFHNTNMLVRDPSWKIGLQKTGFINEAGQCLLLRTRVLGHKLVMVLLHSTGHLARIRDAQQVRLWLRSHPHLMPSHDEDETQARSAGEGSQG